MISHNGYLGCERDIDDLRSLTDKLNAKVVDRLNESQELVMINSFARETNEYQFKICIQERISNISSWRWVFEDLSQRLEEAIGTLHYEHNAVSVVVQRLRDEIHEHSRDASKPGALTPMSDSVETAILEEHKFLCQEKKNFERIKEELEKQTKALERTKKRIVEDILRKQEALTVEESCVNKNLNATMRVKSDGKRKRKRFSSLARWENRCVSLKRIGLQALSNAVTTRQQIRGARVHLSIAAQALSAKVDAALRRRIHVNTSKLEELCWQRDEAVRDSKSLEEELSAAEQNHLKTMEQERLAIARLMDRALRPRRESTRDDVDKKLKDELARLRHFLKHLANNIERITALQNRLEESISRIDCYAEDISQLLRLDQDRMSRRMGEEVKCNAHTSTSQAPTNINVDLEAISSREGTLTAIKEEDEDGDDDPF